MNVQTLRGGTGKAQAHAGKRKNLASQLHRRGAHIVGVQEARSRATGVRTVNDFVVASSEADTAGSYGCELWLSLTATFARRGDRKVGIHESQLTIVHDEPRRLLVVVSAAALSALCVVLHAPHMDGPAELVEQWWRSTASILSKYRKAAPAVFWFVDGNARVGTARPPVTDPSHSRFSTINGEWFLDCLEANGGVLPVTHRRFAGPTAWEGSFFPGDGDTDPITIDFVAVSGLIHVRPASASTWQDFDMANEKPDHVPVAVIATCTATTSNVFC